MVSIIARAFFSIKILNLPQVANIVVSTPPADENGFTNILLMGQGTKDHDGKDLTDSIMLASINPNESKSVVLLSFPRDLYFLDTENMGKGKLNTFYRDYKGYLRYIKEMDKESASEEAIKEIGDEIGRMLDMTIHGVIKVDFDAFIEAVDTLGGIDIDVPYDINDTEYPDDNFGYDPFVIKKGPQHIDGETALKYARSRSTTSDFDRSARQQQLLKAIAAKAKETRAYKKTSTLLNFLKIYADNVETTFSTRELAGIMSLAEGMNTSNVIAMQLSDRNALYDSFIEPGGFLYAPPRHLFDGASVLLPVSIPEFPVTWRQIRSLKKIMFENREVFTAKPVLSVLNAGAPSGHARKLATELTRYGFTIDLIDNASIPKQEKSFVISNGQFFSELLSFELNPENSLTEDEKRDVTIVIAKDYRYKPLQSYISVE